MFCVLFASIVWKPIVIKNDDNWLDCDDYFMRSLDLETIDSMRKIALAKKKIRIKLCLASISLFTCAAILVWFLI